MIVVDGRHSATPVSAPIVAQGRPRVASGRRVANTRRNRVTNAISSPFPSARRWILILKPPWLRCNASVSGSPSCTCRMLVRTDDGTVDVVDPPIHVAPLVGHHLYCREEWIPDLCFPPAVEARCRNLPKPNSPRRAGARHPPMDTLPLVPAAGAVA